MKAQPQELQGATLLEVDLTAIAFDPDQPRTSADETALDQLTKSIRTHGIEQPVILTAHPDPEIAALKPYLLLHGSRRCTAAARAGFTRIPAVLRESGLAADERIMKQLAENDEREDLNVYDRATAVARAFEASGLTQAEFAKRHGKSRPWLSSQLWLAQVEGLTAAALSERLIRHGETARLFSQLPPRTQQRLVETARAADEPITLALVKRAQPKPKPEAGERGGPDHAAGEPHASTTSTGSERPLSYPSDTPGAGEPLPRIPIFVRSDAVPPLLRHFGLPAAAPAGGLDEAEEAAASLAAYLESLVPPHSAAGPS